MVNNSFLYQYIGGDYWGCTPEGQAHLYIIGYYLNGEGFFVPSTLYVYTLGF